MPAPKGHTWNKGKKNRLGTTNKLKKETKDLIQQFVDKNFDAAMKTWNKIDDPEKKVKLFISLLPYAAPRLNNITVNDSSGNDIVRQMLDQQK